MKAILSILRKEFVQLRRDPRLFPVLFISPILQLLLLGYAANLDVKNIPTVICDLDRSAASRGLPRRLRQFRLLLRSAPGSSGWTRSTATSTTATRPWPSSSPGASATASRRRRQASVHDHRRRVGEPVGDDRRQLRDDDRRPVSPRRSSSTPSSGPRAAAVKPVLVDPEVRVWYNPELKSRNFMVPGVLGLILMIMTTIAGLARASSGRGRRGRWNS
ncbi:MAG: hypothetical protein MZV64_22935 [Ignavibacteriales bacterium]|nr:hypothetical protein [Ignavibacteriales bacterium]